MQSSPCHAIMVAWNVIVKPRASHIIKPTWRRTSDTCSSLHRRTRVWGGGLFQYYVWWDWFRLRSECTNCVYMCWALCTCVVQGTMPNTCMYTLKTMHNLQSHQILTIKAVVWCCHSNMRTTILYSPNECTGLNLLNLKFLEEMGHVRIHVVG